MKTFPSCWNRIQSRLKDLVLKTPFKAFAASALTITLTTCRLEFQWVRKKIIVFVMLGMLSYFDIPSVFPHERVMWEYLHTFCAWTNISPFLSHTRLSSLGRALRSSGSPFVPLPVWGSLSSTATWKESLWERKESAHFR